MTNDKKRDIIKISKRSLYKGDKRLVRFLISISKDLKEELINISKLRGQTLTGLIRQILWEWVEKDKKEKM